MCDNFTNYINNINNVCGENINNVVQECNIACMISIVEILNNCLSYLININFDKQLEYIISYCYNVNHGNN